MNRTCTHCGGSVFAHGPHTLRRTRAGVTYVATVPAWVCQDCGVAVLEDETVEVFEKAWMRAISRGPAAGDALRTMRKWLALKATELAELLGTAPETISRWENGHSPVDPNSFALVGQLVREELEGRTDLLDYLRGRGEEPQSEVDLGELHPRG